MAGLLPPDACVNLISIRQRVARGAVRWAPMGLYSTLVGWGARAALPRPLRRPLYSAFARAVGADAGEAERELGEYASFGDFFARRLKDGAREIDASPGAIVAPCDGAVAAAGPVRAGALIEAKGHDYQVGELVADASRADEFDGGSYVTVYLSPANYHRVHAPVAGRVVLIEYVPGAQWPVNPRIAAALDEPNLLAINERAVIWLDTARGAVAVVMVGAAAVGNLWLTHLAVDTRAFRAAGEARRIDLPTPPAVEPGDELGAFLLGSTVVVLLPRTAPHIDVAPGDVVRQGERIGGAG
jgi:phosphatidylserine decarboxylase